MRRILPIVAAAAALLTTQSAASGNKYTLGLNFGSDEYPNSPNAGTLAASAVAGVASVAQANWNNLPGAAGTNTAIVADNQGTAVPTSVSVRWTCPNTWSSTGRGEENNGFPTGPNRTLMIGYLDTGADGSGPAIVTIENLPTELTSSGYDVYVYLLGGVGDRGGGYGVTDLATNTLRGYLYGTIPTGSPSTFIEDQGANHTDRGTYLVLRGVSASSIRVEATTRDVYGFGGTERAPISAIQLVPRDPGPIWGVFAASPVEFSQVVDDFLATTVDPGQVTVKLNGTAVNATSTKQGTTTTIRYNILTDKSTFFVSQSVNSVEVVLKDMGGRSYTNTASFTVPRFVTLDPAWIAPAGSYDTSAQGYKGFITQMTIGRYPGDGNNIWNASRHLAGGYINPTTGAVYPNLVDPLGGVNADGTFEQPNNTITVVPYINWNQDAWTTPFTDVGSFRTTAGGGIVGGFTDANIPGIPSGLPGATNTDNIVMEAYTYVELTGPKLYSFVVNSDDGFRVTAGPEIRSVLTTNWLGQFDGGKGSSDVQFYVAVPAGGTGVYRFRLMWWEGGGGANLEFFEVLDNGTKVLIGNEAASNPNGRKAYKASATPQPFAPAVVSVVPWPGQGGVRPDTAYQVILQDGSAATINASTVKLSLNNSSLTLTAAPKVGDRTRFNAPAPNPPPTAPSTNTLQLIWTDSTGKTTTNEWTFTIGYLWTALPENLARPLGSGTNPGMIAHVHQVETLTNSQQMLNRWHIRDQQLLGLFGSTVAGVPADTDVVLDYLNLNQDTNAIGMWLPAAGYPERIFPGIPGATADPARNTDNIAMEVITYIEFPTAGYYEMGVNSDDGFRVIGREKWQRLPLKVESPSTLVSLFPGGWVGAVSRGPQDSTTQAPLPTTPILADLVATDPPEATNTLNNAAALSGKIALIQRANPDNFNLQIRNVIDAGAIAAIVTNYREDKVHTQGRLPSEISLNATNRVIPVLHIMKADGDRIRTALGSGPVTVSIGVDPTPTLGFFNDGRGSSGTEGTLFGLLVTKAGLYPLRLLWFEGGGGANLEWYMRANNGNTVPVVRSLINDPANVTVGLRAFRNAPPIAEQPKFNQPIRGTDGKVTLTWTGTGTLQQSSKLPAQAADWSDVTPAPVGNTYTVTPDAANPQKYYRIRQSP